MDPIQIKIENKDLFIKWDDDTTSSVSLKYLRDECPCANCKGETILLKTIRPPKQNKNLPGRYEIKNIEIVGGYAAKITWGDGHDTGIYSWQYLQTLAEDEDKGESHDYKPLL